MKLQKSVRNIILIALAVLLVLSCVGLALFTDKNIVVDESANSGTAKAPVGDDFNKFIRDSAVPASGGVIKDVSGEFYLSSDLNITQSYIRLACDNGWKGGFKLDLNGFNITGNEWTIMMDTTTPNIRLFNSSTKKSEIRNELGFNYVVATVENITFTDLVEVDGTENQLVTFTDCVFTSSSILSPNHTSSISARGCIALIRTNVLGSLWQDTNNRPNIDATLTMRDVIFVPSLATKGWKFVVESGYFKTNPSAWIASGSVTGLSSDILKFDSNYSSTYPYAVYKSGSALSLTTNSSAAFDGMQIQGSDLVSKAVAGSQSVTPGYITQYKLTSASTWTNGLPVTAGSYNIKLDAHAFYDGSDGQRTYSKLTNKQFNFTINPATVALTDTIITTNNGTLYSGDYYLAGNVTLSRSATLATGANVTIDLKGFKLSGTANSLGLINLGANSSLTINDSSSGKTGVLTSTNATWGSIVSTSVDQTITINGGNFRDADTKQAGGGQISSSGTLIINGGTFTAFQEHHAIRITDKFTINNGTLNGNIAGGGGQATSDVVVNNGYLGDFTGLYKKIVINGGYFKTGDMAANTVGGKKVASGKIVYDLSSNAFTDPDFKTGYNFAVYTLDSSNITVSNSKTKSVYDGEAITASADMSVSVRVKNQVVIADNRYSYNNGNSFVSGLPTRADTYPIRINSYYLSISGSTKVMYAKTYDFNYTIAPKELTISDLVTEFTFSGSDQLPTAGGLVGIIKSENVTISITGANTNAGTYNAVATLTGTDASNYVLKGAAANGQLTISYTINPKDVTIDWSDNPLTYNGKEQKPTFSVQGAIDGHDAGVTLSAGGVVPGDYEVTATVTNANYKLLNTEAHKFSIGKKEFTSALLGKIDSVPYTGSAHTPKLVFANPEEPISEGRDYILFYSGNVNVGTATITIVINPSGNYYSSDTLTTSFEIISNLAEMGLYTEESVVYDGLAKTPSVYLPGGTALDPTLHGVSIVYSENNVNVGEVTITVTANDGSLFTGETTLTFQITARELTVKWDGNALVYNGQAQVPGFVVENFVEADYEAIVAAITSTLSAPATDAGTQTATFTIGEEEAWLKNYTFKAMEFEYTITPATLDVVWTVNADGYIYNATAQAPTATATKADESTEEVTVSVLDSTGAPVDSAINAGTYTAVASFANTNYVPSEATMNQAFTILPKTITVVWNTENAEGNLTYKGSEVKPTATLEGVEVSDEVTVNVLVQQGGINVRDNSIAVATIDNTNYVLDTATATVEYKVFAKELTQEMVQEIEGQLYTGAQITPVVKFVNDEPIFIDTDYTVEYKDNLEGTGYVVIRVVEGGNYVFAAETESITLEFAILKDTASIKGSITLKGDTTYNGTALQPNFVIGGVEYTAEQLIAMGLNVVYENNIEVSTEELKAKITITPDGERFTGEPIVMEFEVLKRNLTIVWGNTELTYQGATTMLFPEYTVEGLLEADLATISFNPVGAKSNASSDPYTAEIQIMGEAPAYYNVMAETFTVEFRIVPKTLEVKWTNSLEYNGAEQLPTAVVDTGVENETLELNVVAEPLVNVGESKAATAEIVKSGYSSNYVLSGYETEFSIYAKSLTVVWDDVSFVYDGKAHTPTATVSTGIENEYVVLEVEGAGTEVGNYKAEAKIIYNGDNYTLANPVVDFVVKHPTLTTSDNNVTVSSLNGLSPDWTLTVTNQELGGLKSVLPVGQKGLAYYDITMLDGASAEVQPGTKVTVSIKLSAEHQQYDGLNVYYVDDNGQAQYIPSKVVGEYIVFEVDHFSNYAISATTVTPVLLVVVILLGAMTIGVVAIMIAVIIKKKALNK